MKIRVFHASVSVFQEGHEALSCEHRTSIEHQLHRAIFNDLHGDVSKAVRPFFPGHPL